mmetsp:Transcript_104623/g.225753  ORF Transcript_104623/g.225753 Transcript_104623/m.225753 type:complete len:113 (-) Transcript_104623:222-560(-)|eukprot:CAMPEP_0116901182 /NCGR_PEP_ID=MMETSP0467-20121206/9183_1 /TAXON_ID=283647 /ORGANISM="Mesodinium pulex, Strain SPMC105" /LENGTH=112 /DNA_ID=CAMNT_0004574611 /DNA_START=599 /DNA_END=937 /DNA_ORIENTATION=+
MSKNYQKHYTSSNNENNIILCFIVEDQGEGISDAKQKELLDECKTDKTDNSSLNFDGTGIGLSICIKFAASLNGSLEFESELGKGTKFVFIFPLIVDESKEKSILQDTDNES